MPLAPGVFVAATFWPEGIHTGAGLGAEQTFALYVTIVVVAFFFWAIVSLFPLVIMSRLHDLFRTMRRWCNAIVVSLETLQIHDS